MDVMDAICEALQVPGAHLVYRQADPDHHRLDTTVLGDRDAVGRSRARGRTRGRRADRHGAAPRRPSADGRRRRDPVHARARRLDAGLRHVGRRGGGGARAGAFAARLSVRPGRTHAGSCVAGRGPQRRVRGPARGRRARANGLPDLGPHTIGKAGATAVGARKPLVAFNVYLAGRDEPAAKDIARSIRASSGGLPALRAIGFLVPERGCITVSMNLVDFEVTGVADRLRCGGRGGRPPRARGHRLRDRGAGARGGAADGRCAHVRLRAIRPGRQVLERLIEEAA